MAHIRESKYSVETEEIISTLRNVPFGCWGFLFIIWNITSFIALGPWLLKGIVHLHFPLVVRLLTPAISFFVTSKYLYIEKQVVSPLDFIFFDDFFLIKRYPSKGHFFRAAPEIVKIPYKNIAKCICVGDSLKFYRYNAKNLDQGKIILSICLYEAKAVEDINNNTPLKVETISIE